MCKGGDECSQAVHNSAVEWIQYCLNRGADINYVSELLNHARIHVLQPTTRQISFPHYNYRGADRNCVSELLNHARIHVLQPATRQISFPHYTYRGVDRNYVSELLNHARIQVLQPATRQISLPHYNYRDITTLHYTTGTTLVGVCMHDDLWYLSHESLLHIHSVLT
jgi:hypothetical protein